VRALVILLITSLTTVVCTWLCTKLHFGFITAWVLAIAIIFVGALMTRGRNPY